MIDLVDVYKMIWSNMSQLSCPLFDYVPYGSDNYPYAYIGGLYTREDNTKNTEGISCELYVNIYSAYKGRKEILELMNEIDGLMSKDMSDDEYTVFVHRGRHTVMQKQEQLGMGVTDNNIFYHAVLIYDIEVKKKY